MEDEDILFLFISLPGFFLFAILSFVTMLLTNEFLPSLVLLVIALVFLTYGFSREF